MRQKWAQSSYGQVAVALSDVVALDLRTGTAGEVSVRVIGVYNPHQGDPEPTERGKSAREVLPPILELTPPGSLLHLHLCRRRHLSRFLASLAHS